MYEREGGPWKWQEYKTDLKYQKVEMTAYCCHCCYPYCHSVVLLNAV